MVDPLWFQVSVAGNETFLLYDNGTGEEEEMEGKRILIFGRRDHLMGVTQTGSKNMFIKSICLGLVQAWWGKLEVNLVCGSDFHLQAALQEL